MGCPGSPTSIGSPARSGGAVPPHPCATSARCRGAGARHIYTRPYSPWQSGKVERMNRTVAQEWQYARAWGSEAERASTLPAFIERYNRERPHNACRGLPPMSRIVGVNNLSARNI